MTSMRAHLTPLRTADDRVMGRWRDLSHAAADPNPFAHPCFAVPAAHTMSDGADAALLHVEAGGEMVFALPVVHTRRYRRLPIRTLAAWRHPYCFLAGPLTAAADPVEEWAAALRHLRRDSPADLLALELLPVNAPGLASLQAAAASEQLSVSTFDRHNRPIITRRPQADYFEGRMSSKRRKNLRRQRRHLDDLLGGKLERIDWGPQEVARPAAVELFLRLEASGWKGRAGTAISCNPEHEAFFRVLVEEFARDGQLQLWFLEAAGTPVAAQCNLISGDTVFHFKIAYDEALAHYSPGVLLELEMIEEFHADHRLQKIDSCAAPGSMYESLYPESRPLTGALVPLGGPARLAAPALGRALRWRDARAAAAKAAGGGAATGDQE